jgi:hypothetical protein
MNRDELHELSTPEIKIRAKILDSILQTRYYPTGDARCGIPFAAEKDPHLARLHANHCLLLAELRSRLPTIPNKYLNKADMVDDDELLELGEMEVTELLDQYEFHTM